MFKYEEKGKVFETKVEYLDKKSREPYEVFVGKDGKLVDFMGDPIDTSKAKTLATSVDGEARAIFVMSPDGKIYYSNNQIVGKFHHSSFLGGKDVAMAGELAVEEGFLKTINLHSGHYRPQKEQMRQVMLELKGRGADLKTVRVDSKVPDEKKN
jgi:hypothetical protein